MFSPTPLPPESYLSASVSSVCERELKGWTGGVGDRVGGNTGVPHRTRKHRQSNAVLDC